MDVYNKDSCKRIIICKYNVCFNDSLISYGNCVVCALAGTCPVAMSGATLTLDGDGPTRAHVTLRSLTQQHTIIYDTKTIHDRTNPYISQISE